ncbi:MAG TPA: mechanosensitive ion channel family protein [Methanocorpusculum sp.]|nr:mechanosensitive ion channel family protein [Methanocorpusculum sp.]
MADGDISGLFTNSTQPEIVSGFLGDIFGNTAMFQTPIIGTITVSDIIGIIVILILTTIICIAAKHAVRKVLMGKVDGANIDGLNRTIRWIILFIAFLLICPYLHLDLSGLMVAGGVVALAISFACQNTLSNLVAGILLMFERPVSVGQDIKAGDNEGYVEKIGILSTTLRTYNGLYVRVPNNTLFNSDIVNYAAHIGRRFDLQVDIAYSEDAAAARKVILEALDRYPYVFKSPAPNVYVDTLGEDGVTLTCRVWTPSSTWLGCKQELLGIVFRAVADAEIEIPFRQLVLWYGEEEAAKLAERKRLKESEIQK